MGKRKTTEEFKKELIGRNIELLDEYINNKIPIRFRCLVCGNIWEARPNNILSNYGCPVCGRRKSAQSRTKTVETFIEQANLVHNNFYTYDKAIYKRDDQKLTITCPIHGDFEQLPTNHLQGHGCPKCSADQTIERLTYTKEAFIEKAILIHNNKYSYDDVEYVDCRTPVLIKCPVHGDFEQIPYYHLQGHGCPKCAGSSGEQYIITLLNNLNVPYKYQHRITVNNQLLVIDFYIEYNNSNYYIEYNGEQHYIPIEHFGGKLKFERQVNRDTMLRDYCKDNNINLVEIPYTMSRTDILDLLEHLFISND